MANLFSYKSSLPIFIKKFPVFLILLIFFQVLGITLSAIYSQAELFLAINHLHHNVADQLFMIITHLGDWPITVGLALIFLFVNYRYALVLVSTMLYTGFFTQMIKLLLKHPRPAIYFQELDPIYTIPHYALQNSLSFPSGHTTCVFSLAIT